MRTKKGFTLMEILAVLLLIAVVLSLAMPVLRSVRHEMRNSQAKAATKKLADAIKTYYIASRGGKFLVAHSCFTPTTTAGKAIITKAGSACDTPGATGIPTKDSNATAVKIEQLFACGFLSYKDFAHLPYTFCAGKSSSLPSSNPTGMVDHIVATAYGSSAAAGSKYNTTSKYIFVDDSMQAKDTYD